MAVSFKDVMNYLFTILLTQATINLSFGSSSRGDVVCIESEKEALLSFKRDLVDPYNRLSSWDVSREKNCCKWAGIVCNNLTGHVHELHLANNIYNEYDHVLNQYKGVLKGKINPWLLSLKHLSCLDLSYNDFEGIQIPSFMGSLGSLTYLNLTDAGFAGIIPQQLGNLSSLTHLGLGGYPYDLYAENLDWLSSLSSLQRLDFSGVNLSKPSDHWWQVINKLSYLSELYLSYCQLSHIPKSAFHFNLTSLSVLDLSENYFHLTPLPNWLFNLKSLVYLNLRFTGLQAPISCDTHNSTALKHLVLSWCNFSSAINIPSCLYALVKLEYLDLSSSMLKGVISNAIENMTSIVHLDLSGNSLEGKVPTSLGNLCHLKYIYLRHNKYGGNIVSNAFDSLSSGCLSSSLTWLDLSGNSFSGPFSKSLRKLAALEGLDISSNRLNGSLPESLGALSYLESLNINSNMFEGDVSEVHFSNLTNLKELFASGNSLSLRVSPDWIPPFHLERLSLRSWKLGPQFPMWLKRQHSLEWMDLSNTQIADTIPNWFWNFSLEISILMNLSHNHIYGTLPDIHLNGSYGQVYLGSNKFNGSLPRISSNVGELDLSGNYFSGGISQLLCHPLGTPYGKLTMLHLGKNLLSGKVPDCWMYWPKLKVINLGNNALTGEIPDSMGSLQGLSSLHLRNTSLSGGIPPSLQNCSDIEFLDLGLNEFRGGVPKWIGSNLSNLMVLSLRSNILNGHIPYELCRLNRLQILDLADNNLTGTIPRCFDNFKAMATKQESSGAIFYSIYGGELMENAFVMTKGREMQYDIIMALETSLDLSANNLTGEIPSQLTALKGLRSLNLSGNHLKGRIPNTIGNLVWLESLDLSENHLSGAIAASMSSLTFLSYLNVSYNNLSGKIPTGTQLQSFDASGFIGNELCGPPLPNKCEEDQKIPATHGGQKADDGDEVSRWFHMGIATGFAVGFLGIIAPLLFSTIWRQAYYGFFGYQWYKFRYRYNCL